MKRVSIVAFCFAVVCLSTVPPPATAQDPTSPEPVVGLRDALPSPVLLTGGKVVVAPGQPPTEMDVLIEGTTIVRVAPSIKAPAGTETIDLSGKMIYAGLIDAMSEVELPEEPTTDSTGYWNANITPQYRAAWAANSGPADASKRRGQGITSQLLVPKDGIVKGTSCLVLLVDQKASQRILRSDVFQHATLTVPRRRSRDRYPNSPMGATALLRQSLYDAVWYGDAVQAYQRTPGLPRPEPNVALEILGAAMDDAAIVFDAANERMAIRAMDVADEFSMRMLLRGSGREYRAIDQIARPGQTILLPVDFPEAPSATTAAAVRDTPLVEWMHWHFAPENPKRLSDAGVRFCLTTDGLDDPGKFLTHVRMAVSRGLDPNVALAAMTTTPAELMSVDDQVGKIQAGMLANLVVVDGDLFAEKTKVIDTWVAGERFQVSGDADIKSSPFIGSWSVALPVGKQKVSAVLEIKAKGKSGLSGKLRLPAEATEESDSPNEKDGDEEDKDGDEGKDKETAPKEIAVTLENVVNQRERLSASLTLAGLNSEASESSFSDGVWQLTLLALPSTDKASQDVDVLATLVAPDGSSTRVSVAPFEAPEPADDQEAGSEEKETPSDEAETDETAGETDQDAETTVDGESDPETATDPEVPSPAEIEVTYPLGAYGMATPLSAEPLVLFRGATVWTCGPDGKVQSCDVLVRDGKIADVGVNLSPPKSCKIIDAKGKHITPGLIDCHSHIATDGGVNESGQTVTAEVRIADFIDNSDINIYRQLAGGVTTSHILHGSANPIGGQSQTIKFRWGKTFDEMKLDGAAKGIKFALGENVKRSPTRYPNTRMGVEQVLRDQFLAARQYQAEHESWKAGKRDCLPPRRDLQLDALAEIQRGERWVHCHSYRQDEIVATLDVLEEFNVQIGTLQHILEGYKVADRIADHGAMASSFADWWAYKFEVYDAIPYNGVLMHDAGVVVSFNSDDAELARHLNTEAAKATKYGGVPEEEALKFVTLNPAKQLRIDDRVGSIEVGKDADLVIWSGPPMSTTTRCEQTWVDGIPYFTLQRDKELRVRDQTLKARLVQMSVKKATSETGKSGAAGKMSKEPDEIAEEDRWLRYDVFCNARGNQGDSK